MWVYTGLISKCSLILFLNWLIWVHWNFNNWIVNLRFNFRTFLGFKNKLIKINKIKHKLEETVNAYLLHFENIQAILPIPLILSARGVIMSRYLLWVFLQEWRSCIFLVVGFSQIELRIHYSAQIIRHTLCRIIFIC